MLTNHLKIAWRNLFRNKGFSASNIASLTIGMTCATLILLWVEIPEMLTPYRGY